MKLPILKQYLRLVLLLALFTIYSTGLFFAGKIFSEQEKNPSNKLEAKSPDGLKKPLPSEKIQSATVLAGNVKLCANTEHSFEVSYPNDWFTTYNDKKDECLFFAPYTFVAPAFPQSYFTPISIRLIPKEEWESTLESFKNPSDLYNVVSYKNLEINDKPVKYVEAVSTGNSQQKGFLKITYLIFDAEKPLEITYFQIAQEDDLGNYRKVLEEMVNSLRYY